MSERSRVTLSPQERIRQFGPYAGIRLNNLAKNPEVGGEAGMVWQALDFIRGGNGEFRSVEAQNRAELIYRQARLISPKFFV